MSERSNRRLAAIVAADVASYSRLIGADEEGTVRALRGHRQELIDPLLAEHGGRVANTAGDSLLMEFASAVDAVRCALALQQGMAARNADVQEDRRIVFRIGINVGDVMSEGDDLLGDGVNIAARLEGLCEGGGIALSDDAYRYIRDRVEHDWRDGGEQQVKNIDRPVRVWFWHPGGGKAAAAEAAAPAETGKPSIAVLPFNNMSGDPEQAYFADGISEDIITDLSKVSGLFVIARNSSFAYRGTSPDIREVSRALGVRYVLEGSVRRAGNRVRINAQLIEGAGGGHVWADRFDRDLSDIFAVQDEVTREIVGALKVALTSGEETRREGRRRVDPEAYDLMIKGRAKLFEFTPEAAVEARAMLERALQLDPGLAVAQAWLAVSYCTDYFNGWNDASTENLKKALAIAEKACRTDPEEPQAFHACALANMWLHRNEAARRAADRAVALNTNFAGGYSVLGQLQDMAGEHEAAVDSANAAIALDPAYDVAVQLRGRAQFALGDDMAAADSFRLRLSLAPRSDISRVFLAAALGHLGEAGEARRVWQEMLSINPDFSLDRLRSVVPYRTSHTFDRVSAGLEKAGIET